MKSFWSMFGYKSANDLKRDLILEHQYARATSWRDDKDKKRIAGWSDEYKTTLRKKGLIVKVKKGVEQTVTI